MIIRLPLYAIRDTHKSNEYWTSPVKHDYKFRHRDSNKTLKNKMLAFVFLVDKEKKDETKLS